MSRQTRRNRSDRPANRRLPVAQLGGGESFSFTSPPPAGEISFSHALFEMHRETTVFPDFASGGNPFDMLLAERQLARNSLLVKVKSDPVWLELGIEDVI